MADDAAPPDAPKRKKGLLIPLIVGVVLAAAGGGGGYWAVTAGPFAPEPAQPETAEADDSQRPDQPPVAVSFVPLDTLVISLGPEETSRHLLFTAELEVDPVHAEEVAHLSPRVLDVLNSYLRVISVAPVAVPLT